MRVFFFFSFYFQNEPHPETETTSDETAMTRKPRQLSPKKKKVARKWLKWPPENMYAHRSLYRKWATSCCFTDQNGQIHLPIGVCFWLGHSVSLVFSEGCCFLLSGAGLLWIRTESDERSVPRCQRRSERNETGRCQTMISFRLARPYKITKVTFIFLLLNSPF